MGFVAAGIAAVAIGAGVAAYGASKNAAAVKSANNSNATNEDLLFDRQSKDLDQLITQKENKFYNQGNIFRRIGNTGAFGNTDTLKNLRQAQSDFSALAAGDFSGFESQLQKTISDSLITTQQSGAPVGTFAGLAADAQMNYRLTGLQTAMGISEFTSNEANKLLGTEFGIMDQRFNTDYQLDRTRISNIANYRLGAAATEGVAETAIGGAIQTVGSAVAGYGMGQQSMGMQQQSLDIQKGYLAQAQSGGGGATIAPYTPATYQQPSFTPTNYNIPNISNNSTFYPQATPAQQSPFSYGSGYQYTPSMVPTSNGYGSGYQSDQQLQMVLPPLTSSSALSSVGARVAMG